MISIAGITLILGMKVLIIGPYWYHDIILVSTLYKYEQVGKEVLDIYVDKFDSYPLLFKSFLNSKYILNKPIEAKKPRHCKAFNNKVYKTEHG